MSRALTWVFLAVLVCACGAPTRVTPRIGFRLAPPSVAPSPATATQAVGTDRGQVPPPGAPRGGLAAPASREAPVRPQVANLGVVRHPLPLWNDSAHHPGAPEMHAASGILFDIDTHQVIWQLNPHLPLAPASTTKLLTALVALKNLPLEGNVTITADALGQDVSETRLGLQPGEVLTTRELVMGMLMVSANDAATALAVDTVGRDRFVEAMNNQVAALGLHDSHFVTPVGLDDPAQRASAYDLGVIGAVDYLESGFFRQVVADPYAFLAPSDKHRVYELRNLNWLLHIYPATVGLKPGFTDDAGPCLVAMAVRGQHRLVAVLMKAPLMYPQMRTLFEWGFGQEGLAPMPNLPPATH
ncbi:MAG: D-alanyl-D-alanine carboxypeptidase family protein [Candidatus Dormibacteria bacterium]